MVLKPIQCGNPTCHVCANVTSSSSQAAGGVRVADRSPAPPPPPGQHIHTPVTVIQQPLPPPACWLALDEYITRPDTSATTGLRQRTGYRVEEQPDGTDTESSPSKPEECYSDLAARYPNAPSPSAPLAERLARARRHIRCSYRQSTQPTPPEETRRPKAIEAPKPVQPEEHKKPKTKGRHDYDHAANLSPEQLVKMSTAARRRLMRDFKRMQTDPPAGVSASPIADNVMTWYIHPPSFPPLQTPSPVSNR